ncbi:tyrosine-type recombinase/integrase [Bacillus tianshenii]|nr:tyrosine-type recombinase/integrase [Bacillus tianshenii]
MNAVEPIRDMEKVEKVKAYLRNQSERNYILFFLGVSTGLRISDILALKVGDVKGTHLKMKELKTRKSKKIRLTPQLGRDLRAFVEGKPDHHYVFRSREGSNKPISRSMAYKILRSAAEKHNLKDIGTHTLRKTFGYHFYHQTKDVAMLQEIFNHSDPKITLRYIGVNQDILDSAMLKFKI